MFCLHIEGFLKMVHGSKPDSGVDFHFIFLYETRKIDTGMKRCFATRLFRFNVQDLHPQIGQFPFRLNHHFLHLFKATVDFVST